MCIRDRRNVGVVYQNHQLLMDRSVAENVALPLILRGMRRGEIGKRVRSILDRLGLAARERELTASHEQLRALERQQTLAAERQRLMREMHDGMGSSMMTPLRVIEHGERDRVGVNLNVVEGEAAKIRQISVHGNDVVMEEELIDLMALTTPGWMTWYSKSDQYSKQKLSADIEAQYADLERHLGRARLTQLYGLLDELIALQEAGDECAAHELLETAA